MLRLSNSTGTPWLLYASMGRCSGASPACSTRDSGICHSCSPAEVCARQAYKVICTMSVSFQSVTADNDMRSAVSPKKQACVPGSIVRTHLNEPMAGH